MYSKLEKLKNEKISHICQAIKEKKFSKLSLDPQGNGYYIRRLEKGFDIDDEKLQEIYSRYRVMAKLIKYPRKLSCFLNHLTVGGFYASLAKKKGIYYQNTFYDKDGILTLPPFLSWALLKDRINQGHIDIWKNVDTWKYAMTGCYSPKLKLIQEGSIRLYWGYGRINKKYPGLQPNYADYCSYREDILRRALRILNTWGGDYANMVANYLSMFSWIESSETLSGSVHGCPHYAYLSDLAMNRFRTYYPNERSKAFFLAESLYHEAIHQCLDATIMIEDTIINGGYSYSSIYIPWVDKKWCIGRVLHAAVVYHRLRYFYKNEIEERYQIFGYDYFLRQQLKEAKEKFAILFKALAKNRYSFNSEGRCLLQEMVSNLPSLKNLL